MNAEHHPILSLFRYIKNYQRLFTWSCINSILNKILDLDLDEDGGGGALSASNLTAGFYLLFQHL